MCSGLLTIYRIKNLIIKINTLKFMPKNEIILKLLEHDDHFERIEKKIDKTITREEFLQGYDEMMVILKRLDQERIFTAEWVKRIEKEVEEHRQEIIKIKQILKIA